MSMYAVRFLVVAAFVLALAGCGENAGPVSQQSPPAATVATVAATVAASPTSLPPTRTPRPSPLPTPTATSTPEPTPLPPTATPVILTYVFPVRGERIEYGPYHHDYPATDIFCPVGSAFVAPTSGVVDFVSRVDRWDPATNRPEHRGGLAVAIIGDDGWRYYGSHLSAVADGIEPGVRVEAGQVLGYTGNSGNARGTPPHLHFGISRPTTPDDWAVRRGEIPPFAYLQAWERGEPLRPQP